MRRPRPPLAVRAALAALAAVAASAASAAPAAAQLPRYVLGVGGGYSDYGALTPGLASETVLEAGPFFTAQAEAWLVPGHLALRLDGTFARTAMDDFDALEYDVLGGNVALLAAPLPTGPHPLAVPYLAVGAGLERYAARGHRTPLAGGAFGPDPVTRLGLLAGLGVDLVPGRAVGVRLELADRIVLPAVGESPPTSGDAPVSHNLRGALLLQARLGLPAPPRIVARAPAPDDAPAPADAPTPAEVAPPAVDSAPAPPAERPAPRRPPREAPEIVRAPAAAGYTARVGDLLEPRTARVRAARARDLGLPAWTAERTLAGTPVARLWVGAGTREQAEAVALRLRQTFGWAVTVEAAPADAPPPPDAAATTAAFLRRGGR